MPSIYLAGTADTKGPELMFLKELLETGENTVRLVDLSTRPIVFDCDVTPAEIARYHPQGPHIVLGTNDRGSSVSAMAVAFAQFCKANQSEISAFIGIGGGGGTSMITAGMRELRYGVPKIMISTLASGDTSPYVDTSDIIMVPSVTDIAGLNFLSRMILKNAALALLGMTASGQTSPVAQVATIGMTMFGVTTPAVTHLVSLLAEQEQGRRESMVFHATGTGGRTMEKLLLEGHLEGLIDLTTTEIADHICGGVLSAGPGRLDATRITKTPYVGAPGALDMVNFWAPSTIPEQFADRQFYNHNSNVTLMRTTPEECRKIGEWIGNKLNSCEGPVRFLIPEKGISALDIEGGAFWEPVADAALFSALEATLEQNDNRQLISLPLHINDPAFAAAALKHYTEISKA